jgi:hypothetical protein
VKTKLAIILIALLAIGSAILLRSPRHGEQAAITSANVEHESGGDGNIAASPAAGAQAIAEIRKTEAQVAAAPSRPATGGTNKLERLRQVEAKFQQLAAGDPLSALRAAKAIANPVERERALLTLVTEWTHGELRPPGFRAHAIDGLGMEAGLGLEIANNPQLALLWANELTEGEGRNVLIQATANRLVTVDPAAGFGLADQLAESDRRKFYDSMFASWASVDTDAALKWADQLPESADRDAAIAAVRTAAPVGIGTALKVEDGYPVVTQIFPGTAAERNGQIRAGDRIVGLAQGDSRFLDVHGVPLEQVVGLIRGAPNTMLQLQVVSADAPENSVPRMVTIFRDQIKFKSPQTQ